LEQVDTVVRELDVTHQDVQDGYDDVDKEALAQFTSTLQTSLAEIAQLDQAREWCQLLLDVDDKMYSSLSTSLLSGCEAANGYNLNYLILEH
jgi:hypothetical protein